MGEVKPEMRERLDQAVPRKAIEIIAECLYKEHLKNITKKEHPSETHSAKLANSDN